MNVQSQRSLEHLIGTWQAQCNLMPVVEVSEIFQIPPAETLNIREEMRREGAGEVVRRKAFRVTNVLPSGSIRKAGFDGARQDLGPYEDLLYRGMSQDEPAIWAGHGIPELRGAGA